MRKRFAQRYTKRLEVAFSSGGSKYKGISSDLSEQGLFIRTQHGLSPGNEIDIEMYLPDDKVVRLRGVVRRTIKTSLSLIKNGMGVEIIENDPLYLSFLKTFDIEGPEDRVASAHYETPVPEEKTGSPSEEKISTIPEFVLIACDSCKVKNKVRRDRLPFGPRCGKCGTALNTEVTG